MSTLPPTKPRTSPPPDPLPPADLTVLPAGAYSANFKPVDHDHPSVGSPPPPPEPSAPGGGGYQPGNDRQVEAEATTLSENWNTPPIPSPVPRKSLGGVFGIISIPLPRPDPLPSPPSTPPPKGSEFTLSGPAPPPTSQSMLPPNCGGGDDEGTDLDPDNGIGGDPKANWNGSHSEVKFW